MAEAFAKFRVGTPGLGASHASYITRSSALEPHKERNRDNELERGRANRSRPSPRETTTVGIDWPSREFCTRGVEICTPGGQF